MGFISESTIFILGAGASKPYDFPTGQELTDLIVNVLSDPHKSEAGTHIIDNTDIKAEQLINAAKDFQETGTRTIDEFLNDRSDLRLLGKFVIAAILIPLEKQQSLINVENDWVRYLLNEIYKSLDFFDNPLNNKLIQFWTFNYDRSLEQLIYSTLRAKFPKEAHGGPSDEQVFQRIEPCVTHLHGSLGHFTIVDSADGRKYEPNLPEGNKFIEVANNITFMFEKSKNPSASPERNEILKKFSRVCFLGFGYHEQILGRYSEGLIKNPRILGTGFKLKLNERKKIINQLEPNLSSYDNNWDYSLAKHGKVTLGNCDHDCLAFLNEYII